MPPHMHPRSRLTSSLFATTLFASFFVVALPHILPCPAPRVTYADHGTPQTRRKRRRRKCPADEDESSGVVKDLSTTEESGDVIEAMGLRKQKRECPVPKPSGLVGEIMGLWGSSSAGKGSKPP
ncbi:hypothetical protein WAI453_010772 [Rhynchosporium graminicola]|uniref:Alpha-1,3-mannosyltransferase n=1 Tax=Rhynchosporium graminicola TaxID=2792576 RepID=A0A1E1JRD0_9HELO|nr:uncharacterized protein RCO7_04363 [Rhynchosporium commune]